MKNINLKGVSTQTWVRTAVVIMALVYQVLVIIGKKTGSLDIEQWQEYLSYALTVVSSVWAWWKNNSFTDKAQNADKLLNGGDDNGN